MLCTGMLLLCVAAAMTLPYTPACGAFHGHPRRLACPQELRAAFSPSIPEEQLPLLWGNLSHSLSGMFCASLNFLARPETTALQAIEFAPSYAPACGGDGGEDTDGCRSGERGQTCEAPAAMEPRAARQRWLYAALPKEVVCTENLTPALKLLPCRDQAGVASLLLHRPTALGAGGWLCRCSFVGPGLGGACCGVPGCFRRSVRTHFVCTCARLGSAFPTLPPCAPPAPRLPLAAGAHHSGAHPRRCAAAHPPVTERRACPPAAGGPRIYRRCRAAAGAAAADVQQLASGRPHGRRPQGRLPRR